MKEKLTEMLVLWRKWLKEAEEDGAEEAEGAWRQAIEDVEGIMKDLS